MGNVATERESGVWVDGKEQGDGEGRRIIVETVLFD